jgi:hypothetical protein
VQDWCTDPKIPQAPAPQRTRKSRLPDSGSPSTPAPQ